jgi:polar amino acid transport system ATP-binding protein
VTALLEIDSLHKCYHEDEVLKGVSLSVDKHEVVCLIGASGSGKSTLLRCINGLETIEQGEIRFEGDVISGPGVDYVELRRRIGLVFQSYNLFPHMNVLRNVTIAPMKIGGISRAEAESRAWELLKRVLRLVRDLAEHGMTMIIATHEMSFAREVANTVCFLDDGQILEMGSPTQLFEAPREKRTQSFLSRVLAAGSV